MTRKTITERVLQALSEEPWDPISLGHKLGLRRRRSNFIIFYWGKWSFHEAEDKGLIVWGADGKWHLVKKVEKKEVSS